MNISQVKMKFRELESNLENETVQAVLQNKNFPLDKLKKSIKNYLENIELIKDAYQLETIGMQINTLVSYSTENVIQANLNDFIRVANFLIKLNNNPTDLANTFDDSDKETENLVEALKEQVSRQATDIFLVKNELEKLQKNEEELSLEKEQIVDILQQSKLAKKEYEDAKDAAIQDAKLKRSVSYWEEKQSKHFSRFWQYGIAAIVLIILLIMSLAYTVPIHSINPEITQQNTTFKTADTNTSKRENNLTKDANQTTKNVSLNNSINYLDYFGRYALLIFITSSALWIIRIIVKISLSNLHLSEDAHERVVMINTYLAFIKEGSGLEEKDKQLILSSLFRPSNIGIIKDESSVTVADIVTAFKR